MPYCEECQTDAEFVARCAGDNCRAGICPLCFEGDGICTACRNAEAKGIWQREPRCERTQVTTADCDCIDLDEVTP
jgi:hypothetical protein